MQFIVIGSNGKMGKKTINILKQNGENYIGIDKNDDITNITGDVIIDFSTSDALEQNLNIALKLKIPIVIATTNHDIKNMQLINNAKTQIPILVTSNTSILFNEMLNMLKDLKYTSGEFLIEETHHKHKKDIPSGSAKMLIKQLNKKHIKPKLSVHRIGEVCGEHTLKIYGDNEVLQITHIAINRDVFATGAINCAKKLTNMKNGLYSMEDM